MWTISGSFPRIITCTVKLLKLLRYEKTYHTCRFHDAGYGYAHGTRYVRPDQRRLRLRFTFHRTVNPQYRFFIHNPFVRKQFFEHPVLRQQHVGNPLFRQFGELQQPFGQQLCNPLQRKLRQLQLTAGPSHRQRKQLHRFFHQKHQQQLIFQHPFQQQLQQRFIDPLHR